MNFFTTLCNMTGFLLASESVVSYNGFNKYKTKERGVYMNVIFHIDEEKRWPLVQGNVTHMLAFCEQQDEAFHIEIVVNGRAVRQLKNEASEQLEYKTIFCDFMNRGVIIAACRNAMKGQKMEEQELLSGVSTVASGVVELALKQQKGYSYIKP